MNSRHAAEIALGVAGVWLIVSRTPELGVSLVFSPRQSDGSLSWIAIAAVGLVILCGIGLVLLRHRIAAWLVPAPQPELGGSAAGVQAAAFSVVGVFLLAHGLAGFLARLAMLVSEAWGSSVELLASPIAEIAVGAAVFVGSRRLAAIWQSLRTAGVPSRDRDDSAV